MHSKYISFIVELSHLLKVEGVCIHVYMYINPVLAISLCFSSSMALLHEGYALFEGENLEIM